VDKALTTHKGRGCWEGEKGGTNLNGGEKKKSREIIGVGVGHKNGTGEITQKEGRCRVVLRPNYTGGIC